MERSIDELLSNEPLADEPIEDTAQPEVSAEPEAQADGPLRGPDGKFIPKQTGVEDGEPQEAVEPGAVPPTADQLPREVYEPLKAVRNENKELKDRLEAMRLQHEAFMQQMQRQQAPQEPEVDFWDNPKAVMAHEAKAAAKLAIQEYQQQQQMERINASEAAARAKYADYGEAFQAFQQAASANPTLVQQMTAEADPAEFAYKMGRRAIDLERVGSIDELLKAERAKWEAELKAAVPQPRQAFPTTTATDGSVASRSGPAWAGPTPIDDMLR